MVINLQRDPDFASRLHSDTYSTVEIIPGQYVVKSSVNPVARAVIPARTGLDVWVPGLCE